MLSTWIDWWCIDKGNWNIRKGCNSEEGTLISDMPWNNEFETFCHNSKREFINQGRFLFLLNYDELIKQFTWRNSNDR